MPEVGGEISNALRTPAGGASVPMIAFDTTQITSPTCRSNPQPGDPVHTLAKGQHPPAIAFDCIASGMNGFGVGEIANPQRVGTKGSGTAHQAAMIGSAVRRLTPRECERLQGFADDYTLIPWRRGMSADGPRYKALGNSMAVPCMAWIGRRIAQVEQLSEVSVADVSDGKIATHIARVYKPR